MVVSCSSNSFKLCGCSVDFAFGKGQGEVAWSSLSLLKKLFAFSVLLSVGLKEALKVSRANWNFYRQSFCGSVWECLQKMVFL